MEYFLKLDKLESDASKKNIIKGKFFDCLNDVVSHEFNKGFYYDFSDYSKFHNTNLATNEALCLLSCKNKFEILSQMVDLDIEIHGFPYSWPFIMQYNYRLFEKFDYELSVSIEQNRRNFNKSKLSLNMPNATQKEALSWRVIDIMATNSCLLSHKSKTLDDYFAPYNVKFPTYESPSEARELAIRLLQDDALRNDMVLAQNRVIEENCRFEHKFAGIQQMTGVPLLNNNEFTGSASNFKPCFISKSEGYEKNSSSKSKKHKFMEIVKKIFN